ncbi:MAG: hypothetical protein LBM98_09340 [Oscillospiraceae bacterium]|nr:hypothetical protein [Oscillospiraceae bacterium]
MGNAPHPARITQPTSKPYPLCGGVPPQGRGGFPRRARRNPVYRPGALRRDRAGHRPAPR